MVKTDLIQAIMKCARVYFIGFLMVSIACGINPGSAAETNRAECVITESSCPCAIHRPPGTCLRYQGGGTCLLDECNVAYKCDCFGFELCTISQCSIYTAGNLTVPSDIVPFACQQTPNRGNCTTFKTYLDSLYAADNAKNMVTKYVSEVQAGVMKTVDFLKEVLEDKAEVDKIWETIDVYSERVTKDEQSAVGAEARVVIYAITQAQVELIDLLKNQAKVFEANLEISRIRAEARSSEMKAAETETEADTEMKAQVRQTVCPKCKKLLSKAAKLRGKRRQGVIEIGRWASAAREAKDHASSHVGNVGMIRVKSRSGLRRAQSKANGIVSRLQREGNLGVW